MLRKIELHGVLGEKFGKFYEFEIDSVREACDALSYQVEGFRKFMLNAKNLGMDFAVFLDDVNIAENEIEMNTGAKVIRIVPKIRGAGGDALGWVQVIAGAALIGFSGGNPAMIGAGLGMLAGGATSLLMPRPTITPQDPDGNKPSYAFGGAVTTVAEGNPVPLLYGRRQVGGAVISMMIVNEDT
ncbi:tail assembly protein [Psychrobacter faecalis]|uniref:tail assembly protein n=1 Tax=Psychrobacter faecalis TaxID=180588 RepID=UPI0028A5A5B7|nr:tail assembly protein [Psychrobacter faecalis]